MIEGPVPWRVDEIADAVTVASPFIELPGKFGRQGRILIQRQEYIRYGNLDEHLAQRQPMEGGKGPVEQIAVAAEEIGATTENGRWFVPLVLSSGKVHAP